MCQYYEMGFLLFFHGSKGGVGVQSAPVFGFQSLPFLKLLIF
jgi:hypothetical protein